MASVVAWNHRDPELSIRQNEDEASPVGVEEIVQGPASALAPSPNTRPVWGTVPVSPAYQPVGVVGAPRVGLAGTVKAIVSVTRPVTSSVTVTV